MRGNKQIRDNNGYHGVPKTELYDPFHDNLVLGLPMGGPGLVNGSTSFIDCSKTPKTVTVNGNVVLSSTQSKFYGVSGYFGGAGDYLAIADDATLEFGARDFGIGMWFRPDVINRNMQIFTKGGTASFYDSIGALIRSTGTIEVDASSTGSSYDIVNAYVLGTLTAGTWYYLSVCRSGTSFYAGLNGVVALIATSSASLVNNAKAHTLGASWDGSNSFNGYLQDAVYYFDVAPFASNFTPPQRGYLTKARRFAPGFIGA
ncbi:LamG-like jellyroll fold domain-containing protein [Azospirillum sp. sgz301742]